MGAFLLWGLLPVYWKALERFASLEIVAHRIVWSLVFLLPLVWKLGHWAAFTGALRSGRQLGMHVLTSMLLASNWLIYIWATLHGRILEASLGYFLTPLVNVGLGWLVLHERLSSRMKVAIALAALGVAIQMTRLTGFPWVAVSLAGTFGLYGLIRKRSSLGAVTGLTIETTLLVPLAFGYLLWLGAHGVGGLAGATGWEWSLLVLTGMVTSTPLILFGVAARSLPLHTVGLMQYVAPMLQFIIGWLMYGEVLDLRRTLSFALIWVALIIYAKELISIGREKA